MFNCVKLPLQSQIACKSLSQDSNPALILTTHIYFSLFIYALKSLKFSVIREQEWENMCTFVLFPYICLFPKNNSQY